MLYLTLGLGGITALLGFLLSRAYGTIGKLKKEVNVEKAIAEDMRFKAKELRERIRANEEIESQPMSTSISGSLDRMPVRTADD